MKPYIICHMIASVDGRIDCDMTEHIEGGNEYYEALEGLVTDAEIFAYRLPIDPIIVEGTLLL